MPGRSGPRVKQLLEQALDLAPADRAQFLRGACGGDDDLRQEVESLVAAGEAAGGFLQAPAPLASVTLPISTTSGGALARRWHLPARLTPGALVNGRYRVEHLAGEGGMGAVYRVVDTARSRTLALKTVSGDAPFVNLFKIEFRTLASLRHPHLAQSHDFEPIVGTADYCFTMDYVEGRNIFDATAQSGWAAMVDLIVQLCRVLAYVHSRGIVHRDIKPNNVLVSAAGALKLVDFGLVGSTGGQAIGTPAYLAPERLDGRPGDHRSDLYSLGVLAYQLLCRRLPAARIGVAPSLSAHPAAPPSFPDDVEVPQWLRDVVLRLCATQPADRFRGGNEVIEAINRGGAESYPMETSDTRESYVVSGRFVGRDAELAALAAHVEGRLRGGAATARPLCLIGGPSGVGKTRLVGELRHQLQVDRYAFVAGHCFEGAAAEYGAFAEAIVQLATLVEANGGSALVDRCAAELAKIAPAVADGRAVAAPAPLVSPEAEKRRLLDTTAAFLVEAAAVSPYVLSLDDLQWAPQGTVELLRYVLRRIALREDEGDRVPMALLGTYRDDEVKGRPIDQLIGPQVSIDLLRVPPLPAASMQQLLCSMFGLDEIPTNFITRVLNEAGGSPFFLEEVVRALVENGTVFVEDGAWHTATAVHDLEIPATLVAAVRRRLATVTDDGQRQVLHAMAAHKKPMSVALLAAVTGQSREATEDALRALALRNIVAADTTTAQTYRTAHDQVRTTVYADLGAGAAALHGEIARTLERLPTGEDRPLSELAYHFWLAGEPDAARKYALLAGRFALSVYANDEAIEHLEHARALLPAADRTPLLAEVTEQLADAHFLAGHYDRAKQLFAEVANAATSAAIDRVRIQRKLADVVGYQDGTPGEAVEILWTAAGLLGARRPRSRAAYLAGTIGAVGRHFLQQVVALFRRRAGRHPDQARLAELSLVYLRLGYFSVFADPLLIFLPFFRAANVADRLGEGAEHCRAYSMVAVCLGALGLSGRSVRVAEGAVAEAARLGSPWHLANAHSYLAMMLLQAGRWPEATENAERARDGFATCGDHLELAVCAYHLIETIHVRGDLALAKTRGRAELEVFERLSLQIIGKGLYIVVGRVLAKTGDEQGLAIGRDALARAERGGDTLSAVMAHVALGDGCLHLGRIDQAIAHLERAIAIRDANRFDMYIVAEASALLAQAYAAQWHSSGGALTAAAAKSFARSVRQARAAGRRFGPMKSLAALAQGLGHRLHGRPRQAIACFDEAARLATGLGAKLWEAEARLEGGLAWLELEGRGSNLGRASLETALALFRECGARLAEERTIATLAQVVGPHTGD